MLEKGRVRAGQTALRARAARTIRMCSLDARSKGQSGHPSKLDLGRAEQASTVGTIPTTPVNGLLCGRASGRGASWRAWGGRVKTTPFEHPGGVVQIVTAIPYSSHKRASNEFFNNLLKESGCLT